MTCTTWPGSILRSRGQLLFKSFCGTPLLSKLAPKRYGDRLNLEHAGTITRIAERIADARKRARGG